MNVLGISAFYHDSASALIIDGEIIACAQEERFTRVKNDSSFPVNSIRYCLSEAKISLDDIDIVVFYDKPLLKFERLLETYLAFAPKGFLSFIKAIPLWLRQKIFFKKILHEGLAEVSGYERKNLKLLFSEHHLSHAASAFFASNLNESAILTIDGVGEWATASISYGKGNSITLLKEMHFPHSIGLLYSAFTYYCGFKVNSGEYKLMGLAPYGNKDSTEVQNFISAIKNKMITIYEDGSIFMNQNYFNYATGLTMTNDQKWEHLLGLKRRKESDPVSIQYCNLALAIQVITEECVIKLATEALKVTGSKNICMAGGVALNCVANGKLMNSGIAENIYIQPAAGDAGGALGAALAAYYIYSNKERRIDAEYDRMNGSYLGPAFSNKEILAVIEKYKAVYTEMTNEDLLMRITAEVLAAGNCIGWFQGRMEFGPRALGNRSILADARNPEMQKKLNLKIKFRESFRPFAPCVLEEDAKLYFELKEHSPYMLFVADVKKERRLVQTEKAVYENMADQINAVRSDIPAVTHMDNSARIQTVNSKTNNKLYRLLNEFKKQTGYGLLVNTSFNVRGEPVVCTPEDAYKCFMSTGMDYLVMENYIFDKRKQPLWTKDEKSFSND